jgi:hypothetical protein
MPLESPVFVMQHLLLVIIVLTIGMMMGTGVSFIQNIFVLSITLGAFILFVIPLASIVQNIFQSRKDVKKVLCSIPLLIAGIYQTMVAIFGYTKVMVYEAHPDSFFYALLFPIQTVAESVIYSRTDQIFYMGFPYNQLPSLLLYIVILPYSLLIYLLPSINYDLRKITTEMKIIALLPIVVVIVPVIFHTIKLKMGWIDELMVQFFWLDIVSNIKLLGFFLLLPILSVLYIRHYRRTAYLHDTEDFHG